MAKTLKQAGKTVVMPAGGSVDTKRRNDNEAIPIVVLPQKVHVAHPLQAGRVLCGRSMRGVSAEIYRQTPRQRRCRKCAQRIHLYWWIPRWRAEAEIRPGRQRLLMELYD